MKLSTKVLRIDKLALKIGKLNKEASKVPDVIVGYTANYAVYVHENVGMKLKGKPRKGRKAKGKYWDPQGKAKAKFLEDPARDLKNELGRVATVVTRKTGSVGKGLLAAGMRLQRESQKQVPVNTGNLKNSATTRYANGTPDDLLGSLK